MEKALPSIRCRFRPGVSTITGFMAKRQARAADTGNSYGNRLVTKKLAAQRTTAVRLPAGESK
jgi:hypothetical protein